MSTFEWGPEKSSSPRMREQQMLAKKAIHRLWRIVKRKVRADQIPDKCDEGECFIRWIIEKHVPKSLRRKINQFQLTLPGYGELIDIEDLVTDMVLFIQLGDEFEEFDKESYIVTATN